MYTKHLATKNKNVVLLKKYGQWHAWDLPLTNVTNCMGIQVHTHPRSSILAAERMT